MHAQDLRTRRRRGDCAGKAAGARVLGLTTSYPESALRDAGAEWIAPDLAGFSPGRFG